jgi:glycosyltransferase involved in cell wall biosynthesis
MRLAWIAAYNPWPADFGGAIRVFHTMRQASREHRLALFALGDSSAPVAPELAAMCRDGIELHPCDHGRRLAQLRSVLDGSCSFRHMYASRSLVASLARQRGRFDAVVVDATQMSWIAIPPGLPRVLTLHNIEHELMTRSATTSGDALRRWFRARDARRLRSAEILAVRSADQIWTCSERETALVRDLAPGADVVTVPNGVDPQVLTPGPAGQDVPDVIFLATMHYDPNADGACWFVREVWPRLRAAHPTLRLGLVGGRPPARVQALAGAGVSIHPMVPSVLPYYRGARLSVVPLRSGSGTRIKILEAAAVGTPQVSTTLGAEGLAVRDGEHLLIADGAEAFADACLRALADPAAAAARAACARTLVLGDYAWDAVGRALLAGLGRVGHADARPLESREEAARA